MLLKYLTLTYLRFVWINFGLINIVNIYGKLTCPVTSGMHIYKTVSWKPLRHWYSGRPKGVFIATQFN